MSTTTEEKVDITIERLRANAVSESDVDDIVALLKELSSEERKTDFEDIKLNARAFNFFTARENGRIVGMGILVPLFVLGRRLGQIEDVVVLKSHRGAGIGRRLMNAMIEYGRQHGWDAIDLNSRQERIEANKLYTSLGFVRRDTNMYRMIL